MSLEAPDVALIIKEWLKADLAQRFPDLSVRLEVPHQWSMGSHGVLIVANDGSPMDYWPAAIMTTIRITSWTSGREMDYITAAQGRLLDHETRIPGVLAVLPGTGIIEARDEKTQANLCSFTVRTRARLTSQ